MRHLVFRPNDFWLNNPARIFWTNEIWQSDQLIPEIFNQADWIQQKSKIVKLIKNWWKKEKNEPQVRRSRPDLRPWTWFWESEFGNRKLGPEATQNSERLLRQKSLKTFPKSFLFKEIFSFASSETDFICLICFIGTTFLFQVCYYNCVLTKSWKHSHLSKYKTERQIWWNSSELEKKVWFAKKRIFLV